MSNEGAAAADYTAHEPDMSVLEPFRYIASVPGKDIRGKLIDAFQLWLDIPADKVSTIKQIVGELHNASLLIDDIEDNSQLRRGIPVAHSIFGVPTTINTANYVYFLALERCHMLGDPQAMNVFVLELLNLHRGQGQDIVWRDNLQCPTEAQYRNMVLDKTGGLFRLAVGLMGAFSECKTDFTRLVNLLALYFQIRDDLINLASADYMVSKSYCEDLTEGKFSFPIIHCIHSSPGDTQLLHIIKQRTETVAIKRHAVALMEKSGSFDYTRQELRRLKAQVLDEIDALGGHATLSALIEYLDQQVQKSTERESVPTSRDHSASAPSAAERATGNFSNVVGAPPPAAEDLNRVDSL